MADAGAPAGGLLRMLHVKLVVQAIHQLQLQAGMTSHDEGLYLMIVFRRSWLCWPSKMHLAVLAFSFSNKRQEICFLSLLILEATILESFDRGTPGHTLSTACAPAWGMTRLHRAI